VSLESLQDALEQAGVVARVEARGKLAVLSAAPGKIDPATRRRIVAIAQEHGFTNVAVEIAA
jgi:hypothetical protein